MGERSPIELFWTAKNTNATNLQLLFCIKLHIIRPKEVLHGDAKSWKFFSEPEHTSSAERFHDYKFLGAQLIMRVDCRL